jgi:hypothetical protein
MASVEELLREHPARLWRAREQAAVSTAPIGLSTGYVELDRCLPGQGWPRQGLIEILHDQPGIGELELIMPALARLYAGGEAGWLAWISPPHLPYAPGIAAWGIDVSRVLVVNAGASAEWAMEQALRSGNCGAVLGWASCRGRQALRRLQLAAEQSSSLAVLFRGRQEAVQPSPAVLRLTLEASGEDLAVHVLKSRGGRPTRLLLSR